MATANTIGRRDLWRTQTGTGRGQRLSLISSADDRMSGPAETREGTPGIHKEVSIPVFKNSFSLELLKFSTKKGECGNSRW